MSQPSLPISPPASMPVKKRRQSVGRIFSYLFLALIFAAAVWYAGKTGVALAKKKISASSLDVSRFPDGQTLRLGGRNSPVYLADSPESLREFYLNFPDAEARSKASEFTAYGMRRVFSQLEMTIQRYDVDAVQVMITSGSISGAIYWIDIGLLQQIPGGEREKDEIIEPIPSR